MKEIIIDDTKTKKCTVCKEDKTLDHFHVAKCKGTIRAMCKKCACQKRKEYYQKNKVKYLKRSAIQYKKLKNALNKEEKG